jgi:hypothetical protein
VESILVAMLGRFAPLQDTFISFGIQVIVSTLIFLHYRRFGPTVSSQQTFGPVLAFVGLTTFLIISVIKSSFALSLGLVGALSIVRFRTPIKDPVELAYIFLAIASGIGMAAGARTLTLRSAAHLVVMALMRRTFPTRSDNVFMSIDLSGVADSEEAFEVVRSVIRSNSAKSSFIRYETHADVLHLTAALQVLEPQAMPRIANQVRTRYPASDVSFYDDSGVPAP